MLSDIDSHFPTLTNITTTKYNPVPIMVANIPFLHCYISLDNCIILNNPRVDQGSKKDLCFDRDPYFTGKNVRFEVETLNQINSGVDIHFVPRSKIGLLCSKAQFICATQTLKRNFLFIKVPDF